MFVNNIIMIVCHYILQYLMFLHILNAALVECNTIRTSESYSVQFNSVQSLSRVQLFVTPWTAARQATLSITNSRSLLKLMYIKSVMPSNHLILCFHLLWVRVSNSLWELFCKWQGIVCYKWHGLPLPSFWSMAKNPQSYYIQHGYL